MITYWSWNVDFDLIIFIITLSPIGISGYNGEICFCFSLSSLWLSNSAKESEGSVLLTTIRSRMSSFFLSHQVTYVWRFVNDRCFLHSEVLHSVQRMAGCDCRISSVRFVCKILSSRSKQLFSWVRTISTFSRLDSWSSWRFCFASWISSNLTWYFHVAVDHRHPLLSFFRWTEYRFCFCLLTWFVFLFCLHNITVSTFTFSKASDIRIFCTSPCFLSVCHGVLIMAHNTAHSVANKNLAFFAIKFQWLIFVILQWIHDWSVDQLFHISSLQFSILTVWWRHFLSHPSVSPFSRGVIFTPRILKSCSISLKKLVEQGGSVISCDKDLVRLRGSNIRFCKK